MNWKTKGSLAFLCGAWLLPAALGVFAALPWSQPGFAQSNRNEGRYANVRTRRTPAMSNRVYERVAEAQRRLDEEKDFQGALKILNDMLRSADRGRSNLSGYERANIWNTRAFIHYSQERFAEAIRAYRQVIRDPEEITAPMLQNTLYVLAQLYMVQENYNQAIRYLQDWLSLVESPQPSAIFLLAQAYFQKRELGNAMRAAERGLALAEESGQELRESWYILLRALYYENKEYRKVLEVLRQLAGRWPKKTYWVQLGGMYGQLENQENHAISMESAYTWEMLEKESEWVNLAYLLLSHDAPYKAAKVLERGMEEEVVERNGKHLELLGSAWRSAREMEKALPVLEDAAALSEKGEIYAQLASIYFDLYRYQDAVRTADKGLEKGNLKRPDTLQIIRGMSLFNLDRTNDAQLAFEAAAEDERSEKLANQWQLYMKKELRRRELLRRDPKPLSTPAWRL